MPASIGAAAHPRAFTRLTAILSAIGVLGAGGVGYQQLSQRVEEVTSSTTLASLTDAALTSTRMSASSQFEAGKLRTALTRPGWHVLPLGAAADAPREISFVLADARGVHTTPEGLREAGPVAGLAAVLPGGGCVLTYLTRSTEPREITHSGACLPQLALTLVPPPATSAAPAPPGGSATPGGPAPSTAPSIPAGPPAAPRGFTALAGPEGVVLSWVPSSAAELTGYEISVDGRALTTLPPTVHSFTHPGAATSARRYELRARSARGLSPAATAPVAPFAPLRPPTGIAITPSATTAVLRWSASPGATGGAVLRCAGLAERRTPRGVQMMSLTGLKPATSYRCSLVALAAAGGEAPAALTLTTLALSLTPEALAASPVIQAGSAAAALTWTLPAGADVQVTGFELRRAGAPPLRLPASARTALVSGLALGKRYTFELYALTASGPSRPANVSLTTVALPATPRDLTASPTPSGLELRWAAVQGATSYEVYLDGATKPLWRGPTPPATLTGLTPGAHLVSVVAVSAAGRSKPSIALPVTVADTSGLPTSPVLGG